MNLLLKFLKPLIYICYFSARVSPIVLLFGFVVCIWAFRSRLAPRLGATLLILSLALALTMIAEFVWFTLHPPPHSDPDINALWPWLVYCFTGGPLSFLTLLVILVTSRMILRRGRA